MFFKGRKRRQNRIAKKIRGTSERPRVSVFKSNKYIYAQVIDDENHVTLASASDLKSKKSGTMEAAIEVGKEIAKEAKNAGVKKVVFDRSGYKFHGKIKALADTVREGGLEF